MRGVFQSDMLAAAVTLAAGALAIGIQGSVRAEPPIAQTIAEFGLIGTWSADCAAPITVNNQLTIYAIQPSGQVSRTYYDQPGHVYNNYKVESVERLAPDMLSYTLVWDFNGKPSNPAGSRVTVVLRMSDGKFNVISSQGSDGSYFVKEGKFINGQSSPPQLRCPTQKH